MQNCWELKLTEQEVTNRLYKVTWYTQHWPVTSNWLVWITIFPLIFPLSLKYSNLHAQHFELVSVLNVLNPQAVDTGRCQIVSFMKCDNGWTVKQTLFDNKFEWKENNWLDSCVKLCVLFQIHFRLVRRFFVCGGWGLISYVVVSWLAATVTTTLPQHRPTTRWCASCLQANTNTENCLLPRNIKW